MYNYEVISTHQILIHKWFLMIFPLGLYMDKLKFDPKLKWFFKHIQWALFGLNLTLFFEDFNWLPPHQDLLSPSLVSKPYFCQMYSVENQLQVYLLGVRKWKLIQIQSSCSNIYNWVLEAYHLIQEFQLTSIRESPSQQWIDKDFVKTFLGFCMNKSKHVFNPCLPLIA